MTWFITAIALLATAIFVAGRLGLLRGATPSYLGIQDGALAKPALGKQNSVASQYPSKAGDYWQIEPLQPKVSGGGLVTADNLLVPIRAMVQRMPGASIVRSETGYLYAEFETKTLRFVDDVEFLAVPEKGLVHVRSASRLGRKDFGVNRERIEAIRAALNTQ